MMIYVTVKGEITIKYNFVIVVYTSVSYTCKATVYIYVATYIVAILHDMFHYIMIMNLTKLIYQVLSHSVLYVYAHI